MVNSAVNAPSCDHLHCSCNALHPTRYCKHCESHCLVPFCSGLSTQGPTQKRSGENFASTLNGAATCRNLSHVTSSLTSVRRSVDRGNEKACVSSSHHSAPARGLVCPNSSLSARLTPPSGAPHIHQHVNLLSALSGAATQQCALSTQVCHSPFTHAQYAHQISPRAICCTHTFTQSRGMSPTEHAVASSTYLRLSTRPPHTNPPSISPNLAATAHINFPLGWQGRAHGLKGGENR